MLEEVVEGIRRSQLEMLHECLYTILKVVLV